MPPTKFDKKEIHGMNILNVIQDFMSSVEKNKSKIKN